VPVPLRAPNVPNRQTVPSTPHFPPQATRAVCGLDPASTQAACEAVGLVLKNPTTREGRSWYHPYTHLFAPYRLPSPNLGGGGGGSNGRDLYLPLSPLRELQLAHRLIIASPHVPDHRQQQQQHQHQHPSASSPPPLLSPLDAKGCGFDLDQLDKDHKVWHLVDPVGSCSLLLSASPISACFSFF